MNIYVLINKLKIKHWFGLHMYAVHKSDDIELVK